MGHGIGRRAALLAASVALVVTLVPGVASAGAPGSWTNISAGNGESLNEAALLRTSDGMLHVVWGRKDASDDTKRAYWYTAVSKGGATVSGPSEIGDLAGWFDLVRDPELIPDGAGLRIVLAGSEGGPTYNGGMYTATSADGSAWTLSTGSMSQATNVSGSTGIGAAAAADGTPVAAWTSLEFVKYHEGEDASNPAAAADGSFAQTMCCPQYSEVATDKPAGETYVAWYSSGGGSDNGVFVRRILPSLGTRKRAPGSSTGGLSVTPSMSVAFSARKGRDGVYVAYCQGWPACESVRLWRFGASSALTLPNSAGATRIGLAMGPGGRLWVFWFNLLQNNLYATRTNPAATKFGKLRKLRPPEGAALWTIQGEGSAGKLDLVANLSYLGATGFWHTQVLPGLKLTAKPKRFDNATAVTVRFKVTDAGVPVPNARVKVGGKSGKTGANGIVKIRFPAGKRPGSYKAVARKSGYANGVTRIRIV